MGRYAKIHHGFIAVRHAIRTQGLDRRMSARWRDVNGRWPNSLCIGCFGGLLTEEVIRTEDYRYIKNPNFKPKKGKRR
jgi:hypothetical protein